jgi:hypothetical protein
MMRFWLALAASFAATAMLLAGVAYALSALLVAPPPEQLRTAAFEMDLAAGWSCQLEEVEYVCFPQGEPPHDAIAVIAAKYRNANDNLDAYQRLSDASTLDQRRTPWSPGDGRIRSPAAMLAMNGGGSAVRRNCRPTTYYLGAVTSHIACW